MLENTLYRLKNGLGLTVAYFGGSITEGAGASSYENCWAALTTEWLKERFPACRVKHVQAAIGGTDSTLGVYRCDRDVCSEKPNLVFFEFAVNDSALDFSTALRNAEGCFRKIWAADPATDIVTVYTVTKALSDRMAKGGVHSAKAAHMAANEYYGVPQIDMGEALRHRVLAEGSARADENDWLRYTTDTCHPNDAGYALYAGIVREHLQNWFDAAKLPAAPVMHAPGPLMAPENHHLDARMEDCSKAEADGSWTLKEESLCGRYPRYLECTKPGGTLRFRFTGRRIDLYWMMAKDSGDALCKVDDGPETALSSWDSYCKRFDRTNAACAAKDLPFGEHTLTLRLSPVHAEESDGTALRIAAFLIM
ncbi:MAG: SGNH/GDSL hydrolase family protein [Clostridia bacterium]|nr:SGNH/GDSL hydrolase family protein [Clostridia bacterium]